MAAIGTALRRSALDPALQDMKRGPAGGAATARAALLATSSSVASRGGQGVCDDRRAQEIVVLAIRVVGGGKGRQKISKKNSLDAVHIFVWFLSCKKRICDEYFCLRSLL